MSVRQETVRTAVLEDGLVEVRAPGVGFVRDLPPIGSVVGAGVAFAALEALGSVRRLVLPAGVAGRVVKRLVPAVSKAPVGFGTPILLVDPSSAAAAAGPATATVAGSSAAGLVFASPMSGRFYARPSPQKPPLVSVGDVVHLGQAICLVEVMKTFNRVAYAGEGLPTRARIAAALVADGEDVTAGQPLYALEAAD